MNVAHMPGFTADASIYRTRNHPGYKFPGSATRSKQLKRL
jgi:hypothetical protein